MLSGLADFVGDLGLYSSSEPRNALSNAALSGASGTREPHNLAQSQINENHDAYKFGDVQLMHDPSKPWFDGQVKAFRLNVPGAGLGTGRNEFFVNGLPITSETLSGLTTRASTQTTKKKNDKSKKKKDK